MEPPGLTESRANNAVRRFRQTADPAGLNEVRERIAERLRIASVVRCDGGQITIVSGSQPRLKIAALHPIAQCDCSKSFAGTPVLENRSLWDRSLRQREHRRTAAHGRTLGWCSFNSFYAGKTPQPGLILVQERHCFSKATTPSPQTMGNRWRQGISRKLSSASKSVRY
jgi:hypothetical protein